MHMHVDEYMGWSLHIKNKIFLNKEKKYPDSALSNELNSD